MTSIEIAYNKARDNARAKHAPTAMDVFVMALMEMPEKARLPRLQVLAECRKKDVVSVMQRDLAAELLV